MPIESPTIKPNEPIDQTHQKQKEPEVPYHHDLELFPYSYTAELDRLVFAALLLRFELVAAFTDNSVLAG